MIESSEEEAEDEFCRYIHITACQPGGIADADGGFAERVYNHSLKYSKRNPVGFVDFPSDFTKIKWKPGELTIDGGINYLMKFNAMAQLEEAKKPVNAQKVIKEPIKDSKINLPPYYFEGTKGLPRLLKQRMEELDSTHETRLRNHLNIISVEQFKDLYLLIDEDDPV